MKSKELKIGVPAWHEAWNRLLVNGLAIRSSIDFGQERGYFATELTFLPSPKEFPDPRVCRVECKRGLGVGGVGLHPPATKMRLFDQPLGGFLADLVDREFAHQANARIAEKFLVPEPHVATVIQRGLESKLFLPPSHPLLMTHYGMVYEMLTTREKNRTKDNLNLPYDVAGALWGTLKRRFGAFLFQQQEFIAKSTLGTIL